MSPSLARCPVSGPVEGTVLAWLTGSGRTGKEHEWRAAAVCPRSPFPEAHTKLCTSSFPRHLSRALGRVIVLCPALWQNCLQRVGASVQMGVKGGNTDPYGHLPQSRPPHPDSHTAPLSLVLKEGLFLSQGGPLQIH